MIVINKKIFETPMTIPQMVEQIVLQGLLEETNFKIDEVKLTDDQVGWINEFVYPSGKIVHLKGKRQSGRTSMGVGMVLAAALFKDRSVSVMMTVNDQIVKDHQSKFLNYLRTFCEVFNLPELIKMKNRHQIVLVNDSVINFTTNHSCAMCGVRADNVFLDLFNIHTIEDLDDELMAAILPTIYHEGGKLIVSLGE